MCLPDWPLFLVAFFALTVAAAGESLIPFLLGKIIDAVALYRNTEDFHRYTLYLVATAAVTGVFTGLRGSTFMVVGARFSVRMRQRLFDSILRQVWRSHLHPSLGLSNACTARGHGAV